MADNIVVVVIPIYKDSPSNIEILSLKQCLTILNKHKIKFIGPNKINPKVYKEICKSYIVDFDIRLFDDAYFSGINGYNQLMLSSDFYKDFLNYKYLLIYQLDAYVFKDELLYWCNQGYDFIGAPNQPHKNERNELQFLKNYTKILTVINKLLKRNIKISNVGNGGFSLRKTRTFYLLLKILKIKVKQWGDNNEDGFFKYWGNLLNPLFKLPSDEVALRFSIENNPEKSIKKLGGILPFGCHAFEKFEPAIWKKYINF
ncbi:MAG: hypothetical protein EOO91_01605 [Pedobacter sp.]|nr:MAG: hypothetical protein EOO91_01605 [Pedobacter sp.]